MKMELTLCTLLTYFESPTKEKIFNSVSTLEKGSQSYLTYSIRYRNFLQVKQHRLLLTTGRYVFVKITKGKACTEVGNSLSGKESGTEGVS